MRTIKNYVIVKVSAETDEVIEHNIVDQDGRKVHLIRPTFTNDSDSLKQNRIYGQVVAVPDKLEGMEPYYRNYPGFPPPAPYRIGDNLAMSITRKFDRQLTEEEKSRVHNFYQCTPYSDTYTRPKDIEVKVGDKVYFHYLTIHHDNYMGKDKDGMKLFKVEYDKIICTVVDGTIIPVNGYVLIEQYYGDDYTEIDVLNRKMKVRMKGDIVTEINERPEPLQGILRYRSSTPATIGRTRWDTFLGDRVLFMGGSEWENKIEGKVYYTMREWDIVAYWDKVYGKFVPDGDYLKIKPIHQNEKTTLIIPEQYRLPAEMGVVEDCGSQIPTDTAFEVIQRKVHYNYKSLFNVDHGGYIYVRYMDVTMITDHEVKTIGKQREKYRTYTGPINY